MANVYDTDAEIMKKARRSFVKVNALEVDMGDPLGKKPRVNLQSGVYQTIAIHRQVTIELF